jgi:hypothetical protein
MIIPLLPWREKFTPNQYAQAIEDCITLIDQMKKGRIIKADLISQQSKAFGVSEIQIRTIMGKSRSLLEDVNKDLVVPTYFGQRESEIEDEDTI